MATNLPDLSRTEAALAEYDAAGPRIAEMFATATTNAEVEAAAAEEERLGAAVGEAFGLDTADRNNLETCKRCVRPGPAVPAPGAGVSFVRRMVAKWLAQKAVS